MVILEDEQTSSAGVAQMMKTTKNILKYYSDSCKENNYQVSLNENANMMSYKHYYLN